MLPHLQRLAEAVDVLGDPKLGDPALAGDLAVALHPGGREVLGRGGLEVVGAQVEVVVAQHRAAIQAGKSATGGEIDSARRCEETRRNPSPGPAAAALGLPECSC